MIDRSYLPFQSARDYQDPGMQKWMGFFLSEHTTSLGEKKNRIDLSSNLNNDERLLLLSQFYVGQLKGRLTVKYKAQKITIIGEIRELSRKEISVKTCDGYKLVQVDDILQIHLLEEAVYE